MPRPEPTTEHRLPRTAVPDRYELVIEPDLDRGIFTGACTVHLDVHEPVTTLVCNAAELEVGEAWVTDTEGHRVEAEMVGVDPDTERLTVELAAVLVPGKWRLHLRFAGELNEKLHGFYRSTFTDVDGVERTLAVTQFEPTDARRAFPCWDEPDLKATFEVTLVVPGNLTAISNSPERERTAVSREGGDKVAVSFAPTMRMSTYLLAFVVGPLEASEAVDVDGVALRVVHAPGQGELTAYALQVGAFCLRHFTDYYGIPYPGEKIDLVAIPDFAFGAMENLGCVTFREVLLLVDPDEATQPELQNVTDVIAHELAHMWFGDLVTMRWWNGIWLNEAFATFMEMHATDAFRPDWDRWTSFGAARSAALDVDALRCTRPVEYPVVSPDDAEGMFDILTYEKGAGVLRMLEQWLGPVAFRDGIRSYLAAHAYANTETSDLWDALEASTGQPVRRIAESWIFQGGFPLVTADLLDEGATLRLGQQPFGYVGDLGEGGEPSDAPATEGEGPWWRLRAGSHTAGERHWPVPVILTQSGGGATTAERVLVEADGLDVTMVEPVEWVLVNTEGTGFYRVAYAPDLLEALLSRAPEALSAIERHGLVDDAWASVLAGRMSCVDVLELLRGLPDEDDLNVWQRISGVLGSLDRLIDAGDARAGFQSEVASLARPALERLGEAHLPGETDRDRQRRAVLFSLLGTLGADSVVRARARDLRASAVEDPSSVDPAMLAASISVIAASGAYDEFEDFVERFRSAATPQEEQRYLMALADFEHPDLIDSLLAMTVDGTIRVQNGPYVLRRALANRTQGRRAWTFVQSQWETLVERFPSNSIARMVEGVRALSWPDEAPLVFAFFETHEVPQGDRIVAQHLERLEVNVALRARESESLTHHLRSR